MISLDWNPAMVKKAETIAQEMATFRMWILLFEETLDSLHSWW
jgi:hypothetical protein